MAGRLHDCPRPLAVWAHDEALTAAMATAVLATLAGVEVIDGQTADTQPDQILGDLQAGTVGVLVCLLVAAGVRITLARAPDALLVEADWTPDESPRPRLACTASARRATCGAPRSSPQGRSARSSTPCRCAGSRSSTT